MKLSAELLEKTYIHFNDLIFEGELTAWNMRGTTNMFGGLKVTVKPYSSKVNCGFINCEYDDHGNPDILIRISTRHNKTYQDFCETLVHEMVHAFQFIKRLPVDHGNAFNKFARIIKKNTGLNIL